MRVIRTVPTVHVRFVATFGEDCTLTLGAAANTEAPKPADAMAAALLSIKRLLDSILSLPRFWIIRHGPQQSLAFPCSSDTAGPTKGAGNALGSTLAAASLL